MNRTNHTKLDWMMFSRRSGYVLGVFILFFIATPVVLGLRQYEYRGCFEEGSYLGGKLEDPISARRGCFKDRDGNILAGTGTRYEIFVNPKRMSKQNVNIWEAAELIQKVISKSPEEIEGLLDIHKTRVVLCPSATKEQREILGSLKRANPGQAAVLREVGIDRIYERTYPVAGIPGTIFGWIRRDGDNLFGVEGLERGLEYQLRGHEGKRTALRGLDGKPIASTYHIEERALDGNDVILTLSRDVQVICYDAISHWVQKTGAVRGVAIVVKAGTGDFLGVAQYPCVDPANYGACADNEIAYTDFAFRSLFEPGSVAKAIVAATGFSEELLSPETTFYVDNPPIILSGYKVGEYHRIWDSPGRRTVWDIIVRSSNVGMSRMGISLGEAVVRRAFERFGFNIKPDVYLEKIPNAQLPNPEKKLCDIEMANLSFGQGFAISPSQLALAFNVFASNGWFHPGRLILGVKDSVSDRERWENQPDGWEAIDPEACTRMVDILHGVVVDAKGTGSKAACEGYLVGGKSGTAQMASPEGGYYKEKDHCYTVTFAGLGPLPDPIYTIVVVIEKPRGGKNYDTGGKAAAPCFKQIFEALMNIESRRSVEEG